MITPIFHSDRKLIDYEYYGKWHEIIDYLEEIFEQNKYNPIGGEILCTAIFESWYCFAYLQDRSYRYVIQSEIDFYLSKWRHFVALAIDLFYNDPNVMWIVGYTCVTWNNFYKDFKKLGEEFIKKAIASSDPSKPFDVLCGRKRKTQNDYYYIIPSELFPSEAECDKFFKKVLANLNIKG